MNGARQTISQELTGWMQDAFRTAFAGVDHDFSHISVVPTGNPQFGDFQCNDAMGLARVLKQAPRQIAQAVLDREPRHAAVSRLEIAGPGFINVYLDDAWLAGHLEALGGDAELGVPRTGEGRTVVIDYSSPNVAKPMHIGHIRSTIIGNAIDRMHRALGYRVVADNHIGDWGTQFGIIIMGYRHFVDPDALEEAPVEELERVYVKSYERSREDEDWLNRCRQELVKLQAGDPENTRLWQEFVSLSLKEFQRIYDRLGVQFDVVHGESHYRDQLPGMIARLEAEELAEQSEGATVVFLEDEKLPVCIVRKRDGGFNYAASDLATVFSRIEAYEPERIIYVTDERQQLHFRQVFAICRKLGVQTRLEHVWFGLMRLPDATFSTRQGNVIKLERLLDEAESRALAMVRESSPEMPDDQQRDVARAVGIGAVKYADLSQNPQTTVTFTWDKALALDGNSGPYLQYAYARIASVRDKYRERFPDCDFNSFPLRLGQPVERELALRIARYPDTVLMAAQAYKPSAIADYLYDLAQAYSSFYQNVPFLKAPEGVRESRVRLCTMVAAVLRSGLDLLGIETPDRI
jgi:arginyl-tRNA synthetase